MNEQHPERFGLSQDQFENLVRTVAERAAPLAASRAAPLAADILQQRIFTAAKFGRSIVDTLLRIGGAVGLAAAVWHHEAIKVTLFGG